MKLTIDLDTIIHKLKARETREASLRAKGVAVLRDWLKKRAARKVRP